MTGIVSGIDVIYIALNGTYGFMFFFNLHISDRCTCNGIDELKETQHPYTTIHYIYIAYIYIYIHTYTVVLLNIPHMFM